ncbi:MAG: hypothetical protein KAJ20_02880 [Candidatus Aenigmarchaeota archaeon]|nr:hypothetical protein [Candidatus Aenigmarchaeota archaeon]MCK4927886.1 hypothetical protein [Candidatus Aenigmarchaeota archaeon]MCK5062910.1 hypothetical protein [Candidatus Aenigmarchaeota archaeon]MCK5235072.1 hypothetical protein [Candidatus Aenigmarchaeota archaeon]MCK5290276.1 hypothetical protein [Candidatus Aenigmarchaeota archaeon]
MSKHKTFSKKIKMLTEKAVAKAAPRWIDLKVFGLQRARHKTVKRFRSRSWRRSSIKY